MPGTTDLFPVSLLLAIPFLVFLFLWLSGKKLNALSGWIGAVATLAGLILSLVFTNPHQIQILSLDWINIGDTIVNISFRLDKLTYVMLGIVHFVAFLVQVYSTSYLKKDENLHRYFAFIQLFLFSMVGIVLSGSLIVMYIFWELVGLSSYLLIGFWYQKKRPVWAAQKAFVMNRIGDAAFLTGILLLFYYIGSTDFEVLGSSLGNIQPGMLTFIGICLFGGCMGKSAQFPLSGWLPDAMEGPTPVSALIHAATMVAAGIFLLARIFFLLTPDAQLFIAIIGTITMINGAVKATREWDIKKVLAFSTMSQLGLMVASVGLGSWQLALFHLATHAFFKAGLFLSAGSVIHAMHSHDHNFDPQDMRNMGGLRQKLPITFWCFGICAASLAGLPLFSGFLSKDAIITEGFVHAAHAGNFAIIFPILIMASAGLTAYYMMRQLWLVFFGENRFTPEQAHPHESPVAMWLPMALLSLLSFFIWFSINPINAEHGWFLSFLGVTESSHISWVPFAATSVSALAIFLAYRELKKENPFGLKGSTSAIVEQEPISFWLRDYSNQSYFLVPFGFVATQLGRLEKIAVDGAVIFIGKLTVVLAHLVSWADSKIVDGGVSFIVFVIRSAGNYARGWQNGKIQSYYLVTATGIVLLLLWLAIL